MVEQKTFEQGLNTDDADIAMKPGEYRNAINARVVSSDGGKAFAVKNVPGNKAVTDDTVLGQGKNRVIGAVEDQKNGVIYYFVWNDAGRHFIKMYSKSTGATTILLDNNLFTKDGVNAGLNFQRGSLITGVDIIGDTLFWADPIPRCINVKRLLQGKITVFNDDAISLIRRPPDLPPTWIKTKTGAAGSVSLIRDNAFQFAWGFTYYDGQQSVFSPYSTLADYGTQKDDNDTVVITLPLDISVNEDVRFVELAVRFGNTGSLFVIKRWDRDNSVDAAAIAGHNNATALTHNFLNDVIGEPVDDTRATKPFENVPLESKALAAAENRLFLGNNLLGYDTPGTTSLSLITKSVTVDAQGQIITGTWWTWIRAYNKGGTSLHHYYAWVLYVTGYDGITDGYYAVDGLQGSEAAINIEDEANFEFSYPATVNYADMHQANASTESTDDWTRIRLYYGQPNNVVSGGRHLDPVTNVPNNTSNVVGAPTQNDFKPVKVFKTGTFYRAGVVFYDRYLRCSAVVTLDDLKITMPDTSFDDETFVSQINWTLSNGSAASEIPEWAQYYSIVLTKNFRTRNFMQTFPYEVTYVEKNDDGTYVTKKEAYDPTFAGIQIDITSLSKDGLGYVFNQGDIVKIYQDGKDTLSLAVIDQKGKYIICNIADLGDLTTTIPFLMELYTPYKASTTEPFWEIGQMFAVNDPGLSTRTYGTTAGIITGDTWIVARKASSISTNGVEAMSPNDKYFQNWWTDAGRPNVVPQPGIGQARKESTIVYSNQYIPQTLVNGLSSFDTLSTKDLSDSMGPIRTLVFTSKTQGQQGGVMLAICENEVASMYLGRVEVQAQDNSVMLATSQNVIGTVNVLRGSYGTINPESVVEKDGNVYWLDIKKGCAVRYAVNGLFPISDYKMRNFFRTRCEMLSSLSDADIEALGIDGVYCYGGYDSVSEEYVVFLPRVKALPDFLEDIIRATYDFSLNFVSANPMSTEATSLSKFGFYNGTITMAQASGVVTLKYGSQTILDNVAFEGGKVDIPAFGPYASGQAFTLTAPLGESSVMIHDLQPNYHRFDDGQEKVMAFTDNGDRWRTAYRYEPEYFSSIGKTLYSAKDGRLYEHGEAGIGYNTFYDETFPTIIALKTTENPNVPKTFGALHIYGSQAPDYVHIRTSRPWSGGIFHQSSYMPKNRFKAEEGLFYGVFYFDRMSPNSPGATYEAKMFHGDRMRGKTGNVFIEYDEYQNSIELSTVGIKYDLSSGHISK